MQMHVMMLVKCTLREEPKWRDCKLCEGALVASITALNAKTLQTKNNVSSYAFITANQLYPSERIAKSLLDMRMPEQEQKTGQVNSYKYNGLSISPIFGNSS